MARDKGEPSAAVRNENVAPEHLPELRRLLGLPVMIDETGWLHTGLELRYRPGLRGTIQLKSACVGRNATVGDVVQHGNLAGRGTRYNDALKMLHTLGERLREDVSLGRTTLDPGSKISDAHRSLSAEELDAMMKHRQSVYMGHCTTAIGTLDMEIRYLQGSYVRFSEIVESAETQTRRARTRPGQRLRR